MEIEKQQLAKVVKRKRTKKGFTQIELSEKTGISLRSIQRIEKGEVLPRPFTIQALAKTLEFSNEDLIQQKTKATLTPNPGRVKKIILSAGIPPVLLLLAFAFLAQSSTFPETSFELALYWAMVIFVICILQWLIWEYKSN